jgi:hypothetical protein
MSLFLSRKSKEASINMEGEKITVLNPRGAAPPIQLAPMAPRLDTLKGKTIYIVSMNFPRTHQFFEELQKMLAERHPKTTWCSEPKQALTFIMIRSYGMKSRKRQWYDNRRRSTDTCAPSSSSLFNAGKHNNFGSPIITEAFPEVTKTFAYKKGMPELRFTFIPHPFANRPIEVHRKYLEGNDPINGKPVITELIEALTIPVSGEEKKTGIIERLMPRLLPSDTPENLERFFMEKGWTDYLPIVLPTEERVAAGTSHKPDEVIGRIQTFLLTCLGAHHTAARSYYHEGRS